MNVNQPQYRRAVFLAIHTVVNSRKKGVLPAKRREIRAVADEMPENELELAIQWCQRQGLIERASGGWNIGRIPGKEFCWTHGRTDCQICKGEKS